MNENFEHIYLETQGIRLHAVQAGPEEKMLVILLHGFPEFWRGWKNQISPLSRAGYRVLAPDQRGYNLSDKPKKIDAYRIDRLAEDVVGLIRASGREKAVLIGHDWGGIVAWATTVLFPGRVEKLVAINAPYHLAGLRAALKNPAQFRMSAYILFFQLPVLAEAILRNNNWEFPVRALEHTSRPGAFTQEDIEEYRQAWWKKGAMTSMLNWYRALIQHPVSMPLKPRILVPTLILWGKRDPALSPETAELSLELCENGRLIWFEQATHWLQHEEPGRVNDLILDFLR